MRRRGPPPFLLLLLAGCQTAAVPVELDLSTPPRLVLTQARLEAGGGVVLTAAQATVDDLGAGKASLVSATVPSTDAAASRGPEAQLPADALPPPLEVTAPSSSWDLRTHTVRFTGGVQAQRGPVLLTCAELSLVYRDADHVDRAEAVGDVKVVRGQRRALADQATLRADDGALILTGSPSVSDGVNTLSGDRIVMYLDDEKISCDGCRLVVAGDALRPR